MGLVRGITCASSTPDDGVLRLVVRRKKQVDDVLRL
jgi:hypothetical protein